MSGLGIALPAGFSTDVDGSSCATSTMVNGLCPASLPVAGTGNPTMVLAFGIVAVVLILMVMK